MEYFDEHDIVSKLYVISRPQFVAFSVRYFIRVFFYVLVTNYECVIGSAIVGIDTH